MFIAYSTKNKLNHENAPSWSEPLHGIRADTKQANKPHKKQSYCEVICSRKRPSSAPYQAVEVTRSIAEMCAL